MGPWSTDVMLTELQQLLGEEVELELFRETCNPSEQDMGLFNTLEAVLKEVDPEGIPMPMLLPAFTDACFFSRLGIQTYGFIPTKLPVGFDFFKAIHAANERIPVEAIIFGTKAIYELLKRYKG